MNKTASRERILAIKLGALGDLVLADGALQDLRAHHPDADIHLLTRAGFAPLMRECPWVDVVRIDENAPRWRLPAMLRWRQALLAGEYARVYDMQNSRRTAFYRRWLSTGGRQRAAWSFLERDALPEIDNVPERHARQLEAAGVAVRNARTPRPLWIAEDAAMLLREAGIAPGQPFVVLLPGSSARNAHKRWPGFATLSHLLSAQGLSVVTIPGPEEPDLGSGFVGTVLRIGTRCLNLRELAGVVRLAACTVGNDSGTLLLAACLDANCIALFDRDNPSLRRTGVEQRNTVILSAAPLVEMAPETVAAAVRARCEHAADQTADRRADEGPTRGC